MSDLNIKDQIIISLQDSCSNLTLESLEYLNGTLLEQCTASYLCEKLACSRNLVSHYLNEFIVEKKVIKINTRPVYFFYADTLCELFHTSICNYNFNTPEELLEELKHNRTRAKTFLNLVGAYESLSYVVEQCKAAITYPNNGLPLLLQGPTGTGKSLIAKLMYDYGIEKGILGKEAKFVTVNCSEYTNNPEMLMTNLFGYKKGAYTGADKDKTGLIALANGGVLFLDEVHGLKPECQEKIFLFMDKGIYHMVGDNDTWYQAKVRLLFATTENPDDVLLKTLLRRIPILVKVPSLSERPLKEKKELIHHIMLNEKENINRDIQISRLAYQTLESHSYTGNVGELKNCIRASVANAFLRNSDSDESLEIHLFDMPNNILQSPNNDLRDDEYDDRTLIKISEMIDSNRGEGKLYLFNQLIIRQFSTLPNKENEFANYMESCCLKLEQYVDYLFSNDNNINSPKYKLVNNLMSNIMNIVVHKY
ncbi:MAG: sigma 54-interacting transcriptional regulator, partial [Bacilli bacterium]